MTRRQWGIWAFVAGLGFVLGCSSNSGNYRPTLFRKKDKSGPELSSPVPDGQGPYLGDAGVQGYPNGGYPNGGYPPGGVIYTPQPQGGYVPPPGQQPPIPSFPNQPNTAPVPQGPVPHSPATSTGRNGN